MQNNKKDTPKIMLNPLSRNTTNLLETYIKIINLSTSTQEYIVMFIKQISQNCQNVGILLLKDLIKNNTLKFMSRLQIMSHIYVGLDLSLVYYCENKKIQTNIVQQKQDQVRLTLFESMQSINKLINAEKPIELAAFDGMIRILDGCLTGSPTTAYENAFEKFIKIHIPSITAHNEDIKKLSIWTKEEITETIKTIIHLRTKCVIELAIDSEKYQNIYKDSLSSLSRSSHRIGR